MIWIKYYPQLFKLKVIGIKNSKRIIEGEDMQRNKNSIFSQYAAWLLKNYSEYRKLHTDIYRIAEIKQTKTDEKIIVVQVIGKSVVLECTPQEIVMDDRLLEGFSKKDIKTISYFAFKQAVTPKYRIIVQRFCEKLNRVFFKLKVNGKNDLSHIEKTAGQIMLDTTLINGLSNEDLKNVSYIAGFEHSQGDDQGMKRAKEERIVGSASSLL
jgi:hypothetical protein